MVKRPNILITGTPGTGKTTTAELLAQISHLKHLQVSDLVKSQRLYERYDEEFDTLILDEDKLLDEMEPLLAEGGVIVDFHSCDFFPQRWFDLVVVLRTDNAVLYDRLEKRNYSKVKISENMECEIMQVVLEEARESYDAEIVIELESNSVDQMEGNIERIAQWISIFEKKN